MALPNRHGPRCMLVMRPENVNLYRKLHLRKGDMTTVGYC